MKRKMKGRKIYTYRARNRRVFSDYHPLRSAIGTVLTLILVVVIGFVGYNVVGPIVTRLQMEKLNPTATADPYFTENSAGLKPLKNGKIRLKPPLHCPKNSIADHLRQK